MATYLLVSVLVHTPPSSSDLLANDAIDVYWNDTTSAITVNKNGVSWAGSPGGYFGDINTNYYVSGITSYEGEYAVSGYSFCSGADLKWFRMVTYYPSYPYMEQTTTVNSPVCGTGVCDIHFVGPPQITHTTDLLSNNGQIIALAESSNGTVKYGLTNFDYSTGGQTSGTITGLSPGTYTLFAKDARDCTAQIQFTILFKPAYNEHFRFEWGSVDNFLATTRYSRVRIFEREYPGDLVEVDHGDSSPFQLYKPKAGDLNDKFFPIHTTSAVLSLMAETDYQFLPLFTQDDKKYKVIYEVNENGAGFTAVWQGFQLPGVYREDFISVPYTTEFQLSDNLKSLSEEPYTDDNGNLLNGKQKLIKVISHIMKKTGLELQIRSGINIFETNHTQAATDDPLDQTYIDVACYRDGAEPFTCWEVLEHILRPFGARIYQCDNQWQIEEIDRATATYNFRVFDFNGDYVSNGTFDPIKDIKGTRDTNRVVMVNQDQSMEVIPAYGKISIKSNFNYVGSIVRGGFEKEDLLSPESEITSWFTGVFTSEEGFRDWSLKQPPGIGGVSFGRAVVLDDDNSSSIRHISDADKFAKTSGRSVGALFFNANQWSGNLRDAYIESTAKPFQYGPNDEIKVSFDYSTLGAVGYPFIVLRYAVKLGSLFLQNDFKTWNTTETIIRTYPQPSTKLQTYEAFVKLPSTGGVKVDSTIVFRVYYCAPDFYDFGTPSATSLATDGTDGLTGLTNFPTVGINYDWKGDVRIHKTTGSTTNVSRSFFELRFSQAATDLDAGILRAGDYNDTINPTNPKIWYAVGAMLENKKTLNPAGHNPRNRLFYIDNVRLDAYVNGQEVPREDTISLKISKYVDQTLEVDLYNFDAPDITNAKNMYNNYFRLSTGTPTARWTRTGIAESLPLQSILLKVLGSNHSAPTFRLSGSFVNEFQRIGINNYLRLTKPGAALYATNTVFTSDLSGWLQTGSGTAFTWSADNSGSAQVTLIGAVDSQKIYQERDHKGGYIQITAEIGVVATSTNDREDILYAVFFRGSTIIHAEKLKTLTAPTSNTTFSISHIAFAPGNITGLGFFFRNINGTGSVTYNVSKFLPEGTDQQEVYQISDYQFNERQNEYQLELLQLSKTYISLSAIDTGGTNQSGGTTGREHSSAYSSAYS